MICDKTNKECQHNCPSNAGYAGDDCKINYDRYERQDNAMYVFFKVMIAVIIFGGLLAIFSCSKEKTCYTCTHVDGRPLPLAPCQSKPVVIKQADGSILPVKCVAQ